VNFLCDICGLSIDRDPVFALSETYDTKTKRYPDSVYHKKCIQDRVAKGCDDALRALDNRLGAPNG